MTLKRLIDVIYQNQEYISLEIVKQSEAYNPRFLKMQNFLLLQFSKINQENDESTKEVLEYTKQCWESADVVASDYHKTKDKFLIPCLEYYESSGSLYNSRLLDLIYRVERTHSSLITLLRSYSGYQSEMHDHSEMLKKFVTN